MLSPELLKEISKLKTSEDCRAAWAEIKQKWSRLQVLAIDNFNVGDKVQFKGKYGKMEQGVITKLNVKSAKVTTAAGIKWSVSPSLLTVIK